MVTDDRSGGNLSLCLTFPETRQQVRVVGSQEHPEFVAKDVCEILELSNVTEALRSLDPDERGSVILNTPGGPQEMLTVTEPGLYRLVSVSRKPAARVFQRWVFHEVLPALRLHGCYPPPPVPKNPTSLVLRHLADTLERQDRLEARLERVAGKVRDLDADTGYITLLAYCRLKRIDLPCSDARRHGKALSRIHRNRSIKTGWASDERYGKVKTYQINVVEEYFAGLEGES